MLFDFLLASFAIIFGYACMFQKQSLWKYLTRLLPGMDQNAELSDDWRLNLNMLGGASFVTGVFLLLLI